MLSPFWRLNLVTSTLELKAACFSNMSAHKTTQETITEQSVTSQNVSLFLAYYNKYLRAVLWTIFPKLFDISTLVLKIGRNILINRTESKYRYKMNSEPDSGSNTINFLYGYGNYSSYKNDSNGFCSSKSVYFCDSFECNISLGTVS
jgi:hypothetical protein